jgi:hypothetical protein
MDSKVTGWIDLIVTTFIGWVNKGFEFFGLYTSKYAGWIVGIIALWILSKMLKFNIKTGGGR